MLPKPSIRAAVPKLLIFAICVTTWLQAQTPDVTLRVDVKLVNVFVNVTDANGAIVGGLTRDDFALAEDNRPQDIAVFERQSELPLNLTLAIDTSASVYKDRAIEQEAAKRFVHALMRPDPVGPLDGADGRAGIRPQGAGRGQSKGRLHAHHHDQRLYRARQDRSGA